MSALHRTRRTPQLLAFAGGLLLALGLWAEAIERWWSLRAASDAAASPALAASPWAASGAAPAACLRASAPQAPPRPASPAPSNTEACALEPDALAWLPVLQAHGLQLQTLQTLPSPLHAATAPGAAQPELSLTAQGPWHAWLALERSGLAGLAGWVPQSWQVQALGPPAAAGQVQLHWQLRWSGATAEVPRPSPSADAGPESEAAAPGRRPGDGAAWAAEVFVPAPTLALAAARPERADPGAAARQALGDTAARVPNRAHESRAAKGAPGAPGAPGASGAVGTDGAGTSGTGAWRLLGVWQQAGVSHAVATSAGRLQALRIGQRLGQARVQRIDDGQVWLGEGADARTLRPWLLGTSP